MAPVRVELNLTFWVPDKENPTWQKRREIQSQKMGVYLSIATG